MSRRRTPEAAAGTLRRSQAERRAESRRRLLDATVAGLSEDGVAATTVAAVAARAGLSVGCLQNHFPSKADLLAEAIADMFDGQVVKFRARIARLPRTQAGVGAAVRVIWELYRQPGFRAFLEVLTEARRNPQVRRQLRRAQDRMGDLAIEVFWDVFEPHPRARVDRVGLPSMVLATVQGLELSRLAHPARRDWEPALATLEGTLRGLVRPRRPARR